MMTPIIMPNLNRKGERKETTPDKNETETSTELTPLEVALDHYGKKIADQLVTTDSEDSDDYVLLFINYCMI